MNLYELKETYKRVQDLIEDGGEGLSDTLESIVEAIEDKAVNYAKVIKNIDSQITSIKEEEQRLESRRKSLENNVKNLKSALEIAMLDSDMKKIKTPLFSFNIQKNSPSLDIVDTSAIPLAYYVDQEPKLDKRKLLNDIKNNDVFLPGVEIRQSESLRIR
jgi:Siphovirus Gp157